MREASEIPRETREELWRSNIAGALRGIRGDLDLLVMQETPPEAVEFGYFHHLGLPYSETWSRPFVASARAADAIREGELLYMFDCLFASTLKYPSFAAPSMSPPSHPQSGPPPDGQGANSE